MGWRNYFFVLNDLRCRETLKSPEFKSLMSWVKADIDRQRARVEAIDAKEDFRAYVESQEASEQMKFDIPGNVSPRQINPLSQMRALLVNFRH